MTRPLELISRPIVRSLAPAALRRAVFYELELDPEVCGVAPCYVFTVTGLTVMANCDVDGATFVALASIQLALRRLARAEVVNTTNTG